MPVVDVGRDSARDAAGHELAKPIYPQPSTTERLASWFDDVLYRIQVAGSSVPGGWLTITVLALLLAVAIVVAVRIAMRTTRSRRSAGTPLFDHGRTTAAEHRATARAHAAAGEWAAATRHQLRSIARQLEETAVLNEAPGRTATELGREAGAALPALRDEFHRAAQAFNGVTYGGQPGTEGDYRQIVALDEHLRTRSSTSGPTATGGTPDVEWVAVP